MLRLLAIFFWLLIFSSCTSGSYSEKRVKTDFPSLSTKTSLDRKLEGAQSQELPINIPVDVNKVDPCTRHLLFADQYITIADYDSASLEVQEAGKYCSPDDPRFNYMKAVILDAKERREEAYTYYYRAAKGYLEAGDYDSAFKCYSNMLSINPSGKEVKELRSYFQDEDY